MKKIIIILCAILPALFSCNSFLDVSSESKVSEEVVYSNIEEANRVLTSVYASLLSNGVYGNNYMSDFALNSDVEFVTFNTEKPNADGRDFKCFDGSRFGSAVASTWAAAYQGAERSNVFINGMLNGSLYRDKGLDKAKEKDVMQLLGEGKVLRAMFYHDLVVHFGDVPFSTSPSCVSCDPKDLITPITDRNKILTFLINDLKNIAPQMKYARELDHGIERVSREFCYAMIARMALTRGGYALYPDKSNPSATGFMERQSDYRNYYEIAMNYADSVIISGTHSLKKPFRQVFIDECNYIVTNDDDPVFEISFLKNSSGNVGYVHGPQAQTTSGETSHDWGECNGGVRLNTFYRFSFDRKDLRRDYTIGMWYYNYAGQPQIRTGYNTHCNKWSKLWSDTKLGSGSKGGTGFNYPYMRYADVLLMYAEAVNEVEYGVWGPHGDKAKWALLQVRNRAFEDDQSAYVESVSDSKEDFFKAIYNERKWEFGGENMRWKDLVRWNLYSRVVYDCFMEYYKVAMWSDGDYDQEYFGAEDTPEYLKKDLPTTVYWKRMGGDTPDKNPINPNDINIYPNKSLQIIEFYKTANGFDNLYDYPTTSGTGAGYNHNDSYFNWIDENTGFPKKECLYSFRGYIWGSEDGRSDNFQSFKKDNLPPVRYILPIPNGAVQMSRDAYKNYYGY